MERILEQMSDPTWWFSVVAVGLLLSVAGAFLARYIEKFFARYFEYYKTKKQKSDQNYKKIAEVLENNPTLFIIFMHQTQTLLTLSLCGAIMTVFFLLVSTIQGLPPALVTITLLLAIFSGLLMLRIFHRLNLRLSIEHHGHNACMEKLDTIVREKLREATKN